MTSKDLLNKVFLTPPVLLFLYSSWLLLVNGFGQYRVNGPLWRPAWHTAYYFYVVTFFAVLGLFLQSPHKSVRSFFSSFRYWFVGLIFSMFSYALAAFTFDLGTVLSLLPLLFRK